MAMSLNSLALTHRFMVMINAKDYIYLAVKLEVSVRVAEYYEVSSFWLKEEIFFFFGLLICPCSRKIGHGSKYNRTGQSLHQETLYQKSIRGRVGLFSYFWMHIIFHDKQVDHVDHLNLYIRKTRSSYCDSLG